MRHSKEILSTAFRVFVSLSKLLAWVAVAISFWNQDWQRAQTILLLLIASEVTKND